MAIVAGSKANLIISIFILIKSHLFLGPFLECLLAVVEGIQFGDPATLEVVAAVYSVPLATRLYIKSILDPWVGATREHKFFVSACLENTVDGLVSSHHSFRGDFRKRVTEAIFGFQFLFKLWVMSHSKWLVLRLLKFAFKLHFVSHLLGA